MLKNRVCYVLLLIAIAMLYIFTNTYYTLTLLLMCIFLPILSLVLMLFSRSGLTIYLEVPKTTEKSDAVIKYTFENRSRLPVARVAFKIHMENQMTGTVKNQSAAASVGGRSTVNAQIAIKNSKVGTVLVHTEKIRVYDSFGLFSFRKAKLPVQAMIVYPDFRNISVHMARLLETAGESSRYSPERAGSDVNEIFALREYAAGDEIRKIHWKLSSKIDSTMVRDFSNPLNYPLFLLLELNKGSEELVDSQVELYLTLSRALLEKGVNHNMGWYDAGEEVFHREALDDFEGFELASAQLLSSFATDKKGSALEHYIANGYPNQKNILLYVAADPELDRVAEIEALQQMQTVMIYEDEAAADAAKQSINVIAASVKEAAESLPEIIV